MTTSTVPRRLACSGCPRVLSLSDDAVRQRLGRGKYLCDFCGGPLDFPDEYASASLVIEPGAAPGTVRFAKPMSASLKEKLGTLRAEELASAERGGALRGTVRVLRWLAYAAGGLGAAAIAYAAFVVVTHVDRGAVSQVSGARVAMKFVVPLIAAGGVAAMHLVMRSRI